MYFDMYKPFYSNMIDTLNSTFCDMYKPVLFKHDRYTELYILFFKYVNVTLIQGHGMHESKTFCASFLQKFLHYWVWMEIGMLSRLVSLINFSHFKSLKLISLINLILILSHPVSIQGRESNLDDFIQKKQKRGEGEGGGAGFHLDIYRLMSFKVGAMMDAAVLYCLVWVWMTLTFAQFQN